VTVAVLAASANAAFAPLMEETGVRNKPGLGGLDDRAATTAQNVRSATATLLPPSTARQLQVSGTSGGRRILCHRKGNASAANAVPVMLRTPERAPRAKCGHL
jgi:hypothetical protein